MRPPAPGAAARRLGIALFWLLAATSAVAAADDGGKVAWRELQPGIEYAVLPLASAATGTEGRLHAVRIDPKRAQLRALMASEHGGEPRTAARWSEEFGLSVAINLGMYQEDGVSNVGYARNGEHVNSRRWAGTFQSALAFSPGQADLPPAVVVDLDREGARESLDAYGTVIQNLRLIKSPGTNVWSKQERRWSEAALAMDGAGRLLFLLAPEPFAMWDLNETLLALPLGIERAMHLEGGTQASLSIRTDALRLDLSGGFDTGFGENEAGAPQRRIPNVIGVAAGPATP